MSDKQNDKQNIDFSKVNLVRTAHNYLMKEKGGEYALQDINTLNLYLNHVFNPENRDYKPQKVAVLLLCVNQPYWEFINPLLGDMQQLFLPGHDVSFLIWSDLWNYPEALASATFKGEKYPVEPIEWPMGTLMRYNVFLQEEEKLKEFDYLFYIDVDMRIVNVVGDEILGEGLTMAEHPMYALRKEYVPPYEPNDQSTAYIPRLGQIIDEQGKKRLKPLYAAGGFQGGKADLFIEAMKTMRANINKDFNNNYIAIWNDESHWNKYLFGYKGPLTALGPAYIYPDSLINEYYTRIWGRNYTPRIVTLTKKFTTSKEGGAAIAEKLKTM